MAISKVMISAVSVWLMALFLLQSACHFKPAQAQGLAVGFYASSCPTAEQVVTAAIRQAHVADKTITASLLRLFFHDCFVQGCDASILLNGTGTSDGNTELTAGPNLSVRGTDVIENAKAELETICPGVVSCADIVALAARDATAILGGPAFDMPTGRFDALTAGDPSVLPGPDFSIDDASQAFINAGLSLQDMVNLLGAHTVGVAQCQFFKDRLYDFQGTGGPDPTLDTNYLTILQRQCPNDPSSDLINVGLDFGSEFRFDNSYWANLLKNRGLLTIDAELKSDSRTKRLVSSFAANNRIFNGDFVNSMISLSQLGVLTSGSVRTDCAVPPTGNAASSFDILATFDPLAIA